MNLSPFKLCVLVFFITCFVNRVQGLNVNGTIIQWDPEKEETFKSSLVTEFDSQGLSPWYALANSFISTVLNTEPYDVAQKAIDGNIMNDPVNDLLLGYGLGLAIVIGLGLLFCIIMPIVGFCFCCCRCCNNCGGEMTQKDLPRNGCKRAVFGIILSIITLLMFAGVLLTFVCNDNMSKTLEKTQKTTDGIVEETKQFINTTIGQFDDIINKDFPFVLDQLKKDISDDGVKVGLGDPFLALIKDSVERPIQAVTNLSTNSEKMKTQLQIIVKNTRDLENQTTALSVGLTKAKSDIETLIASCNDSGLPFCSNIDASQLQAGANFSKVPNVEDQLGNIKGVTDLDFVTSAQEGLQTIYDIPVTLLNKTKDARNGILNMIKNATTTVDKLRDDLTKESNKKIMDPLETAGTDIKNIVEDGKKYDKYRWYAGVGLTCLLLLIVVLMALGLMCGICGHDKDATSSNRGSVSNMGGNALMAATGFCFIFASFLMLLTTICFLIGAPMRSVICEPIQSGEIFSKFLDNKAFWKNGQLPLSKMLGGKDIKIGETLDNCRKNMPAYPALHLDQVYNISAKLNIKELLGDKVDSQFDNLNVNLSDQTILTNKSKQSLDKLISSGVSNISFDQFFNETKKGITTVNLTDFAKKLDAFSDNATKVNTSFISGEDKTKLEYIAGNATKIANDLRALDKDVVQAMDAKSKEMQANVEGLKLIGGNLEADATNALNEAEQAEIKLHDATEKIPGIIITYKDRVLGWGYQFTDHIKVLLDTQLGRCKPLTNIFDAVVVLACNEFLDPFNGFWLGIGFCLFFFIPSIIFSVKLAKHYRCMNYEGEFDGQENIEMQGQPPSYDSVGQEKKLWANPKQANGNRH